MKKTGVVIYVLLVVVLLFIPSCRHDVSTGSHPVINNPVNPENNGNGNVPSGNEIDVTSIELSGTIIEETVHITKVSGYLNSAYVEFDYYPEAAGYIVKLDGNTIDNELIRGYENCLRADALGLSAGMHEISVQAVFKNGDVTTPAQNNVEVINHDRSGFAFSNTNQIIPGAYKMDGTLKDDAVVIYVSKENARTVTAAIKGKEGSKDKTATYKGLQGILAESNCKYYSQPVCVRIIGLIKKDDVDTTTNGWSSAEGLQLKNNGAKSSVFPGITLEGVGEDATLWGFGVMGRNTCAWEIANLGIMNFMDDGISLDTNNNYVWVHNCDFFYGKTGSDSDQAKGDGTLDVKDNSQYNTYSYNHFWDSGKASLCGMKSEAGPNYITYHHNWFDHSDSRHPRIRTMSVHVYNNYFDGNAKYGIGVTSGASCFAEGNYFRNAHNPMMSSLQGTDATGDGTFSGEEGGMIKSWNNKFTECGSNEVKFQFVTNKKNYTGKTYETGDAFTGTLSDIDCYEVDSRNEVIPDTVTTKSGNHTYNNFDTVAGDAGLGLTKLPTDPDTAKADIIRYAGRVNGGDFKWTFDNKTEDANYGVNYALKAAVESYTGKLKYIQGIKKTSSESAGGTDTSGAENGGADSGEAQSGGTTPVSTGATVVSFAKGAVSSDDRVSGSTGKEYSTAQTYNGNSYTYGAKLNSSGLISLTLEKAYKVSFVLGTDKSGYSKGLNIDDTAFTPSENVVTCNLSEGTHTIKNGGSETSVFLIILE